MLYDSETDMYVPVIFYLVDNKKQWTYWHVLHFMIVLTDAKIDPATFTTEFEVALLNAIDEQFRGVRRVGCAFHFKQALRRQMQQLQFSPDAISEAMRPGMLDALHTTPRNQIKYAITKLRESLEKHDADRHKILRLL